jgi:hypothetical protein
MSEVAFSDGKPFAKCIKYGGELKRRVETEAHIIRHEDPISTFALYV